MNDLHDSRNLTMLTDFYELLICFSAPYPTAAVM